MKTSIHKLFGAKLENIDEARTALERLLGVRFAPHESLYFGGDYFRFEEAGTTLMLRCNFFDDDGDWVESAFPDERLLLNFDAGAGNPLALEILKRFANALEIFPLLRDDSR